MKSNGRSGNKTALRKTAEKRVRASAFTPKQLPKKDVLELIHELEVHRVELEIQNAELRRSQAELEGSRQKYFRLYDLAPVGYANLDQSGVIREINLAGAELLGQPRRYLKGVRFARYVDEATRYEFYRFYKWLFDSGKRKELEIRLLPREHGATHLLLSAVVVPDGEDKMSLCQMAMTDISEKMKLQTELLEQARLAAIGEMAAEAAHEIANPIHAMAISIEFLERGSSDRRWKRSCDSSAS